MASSVCLSFNRANAWILKWFQRKAVFMKLIDPDCLNTTQTEMIRALEAQLNNSTVPGDLLQYVEHAMFIWTKDAVPPCLRSFVNPNTVYVALGDASNLVQGMLITQHQTPAGLVTVIDVDTRAKGGEE